MIEIGRSYSCLHLYLQVLIRLNTSAGERVLGKSRRMETIPFLLSLGIEVLRIFMRLAYWNYFAIEVEASKSLNSILRATGSLTWIDRMLQ